MVAAVTHVVEIDRGLELRVRRTGEEVQVPQKTRQFQGLLDERGHGGKYEYSVAPLVVGKIKNDACF